MLLLCHATEAQINMIAIDNPVIFRHISVPFGDITAWSSYREVFLLSNTSVGTAS